MAQMVGSAKVGELSKFQRVDVIPSTNLEISITHTLGVQPKIVILSSEQTFVSNQYILGGVFDQQCGCVRCFNSEGGTTTNSFFVLYGSGTSNSYMYVTDTNITIRRATSSRYFDTSVTYTVDIYA